MQLSHTRITSGRGAGRQGHNVVYGVVYATADYYRHMHALTANALLTNGR